LLCTQEPPHRSSEAVFDSTVFLWLNIDQANTVD
jgi:hypothetical protein